MRIELCGGIASGKTTFAHALETHLARFTVVCENFTSNTFLDDFYKDAARYAYETEISFLLQHMHQIKTAQSKGVDLVCDFSLEQDYAYAVNNLETVSKSSFEEVYRETIRQIGLPDLIVFLQCPSHVLVDRIHARGRNNEMEINAAYLDDTVLALRSRLSWQKSTVIEIDSNHYDFRESNDMKRVIASILQMHF